MSTHFMHGELTQESVTSLISIIDKDEDINIDLYFSSTGGSIGMAEVLVDYIGNAVKDITLIAHWHIMSCALDVFTRSVCKKRVLDDAYGMVHLADRDASVRDLKDRTSQDSFLVDDLNRINKAWLKERQHFFTSSELAVIKKGGSIYLDHDRLLKYIDEFSYVLVEEESKEV